MKSLLRRGEAVAVVIEEEKGGLSKMDITRWYPGAGRWSIPQSKGRDEQQKQSPKRNGEGAAAFRFLRRVDDRPLCEAEETF